MAKQSKVKARASETVPEIPVKLVPEPKAGKYADGMPLHEVRYLECKLIEPGQGVRVVVYDEKTGPGPKLRPVGVRVGCELSHQTRRQSPTRP